MALELYIPPCLHVPVHPKHPPSVEKPLRIQIEGPLISIQKLVPEAQWHIDIFNQVEESRLYVVHHSPVAGDVQTPLWIRVQPKTDKIPPSNTLATFSKTNLLVSPELLSPGQKRLYLAGKGYIITVPIPDAAESLGHVGYYCITIHLLVPEESLWGVRC
ncbi:unnamed protein product [Clonostachys rosea f. rosea IK726]|uniref:Uncharacterized protein n=1 Tax=Clonostachys rosea f. rosea IK726 TaxID=1349383 RepID=A0ACA9UL19_BIOOC|nr:unnamed protein product [Clonostachys rosea f. rosea IK726]